MTTVITGKAAMTTSKAATPLRDRKRLRMRRELAEAAVDLFEEFGYEQTTVEAVADRAGYSPSSVFRQFAGKEDIVFFDFPERLDRLRITFGDTSDQSVWVTVRRAFLENARWWADEQGLFGVRRASLFHTDPTLYGRYLTISEEWAEEIVGLIARDRGVDGSVDVASRAIAGAAIAAVRAAWRAQAVGGGDFAAQLDVAFTVLERGLDR